MTVERDAVRRETGGRAGRRRKAPVGNDLPDAAHANFTRRIAGRKARARDGLMSIKEFEPVVHFRTKSVRGKMPENVLGELYVTFALSKA